MMSLKAVVYDQEQWLNTNHSNWSVSYRSNRGKYENTSISNKPTDLSLKKNIGVESRSPKIKIQGKNERKDDKVTAALKANAELCDKISKGQIDICSES